MSIASQSGLYHHRGHISSSRKPSVTSCYTATLRAQPNPIIRNQTFTSSQSLFGGSAPPLGLGHWSLKPSPLARPSNRPTVQPQNRARSRTGDTGRVSSRFVASEAKNGYSVPWETPLKRCARLVIRHGHRRPRRAPPGEGTRCPTTQRKADQESGRSGETCETGPSDTAGRPVRDQRPGRFLPATRLGWAKKKRTISTNRSGPTNCSV